MVVFIKILFATAQFYPVASLCCFGSTNAASCPRAEQSCACLCSGGRNSGFTSCTTHGAECCNSRYRARGMQSCSQGTPAPQPLQLPLLTASLLRTGLQLKHSRQASESCLCAPQSWGTGWNYSIIPFPSPCLNSVDHHRGFGEQVAAWAWVCVSVCAHLRDGCVKISEHNSSFLYLL